MMKNIILILAFLLPPLVPAYSSEFTDPPTDLETDTPEYDNDMDVAVSKKHKNVDIPSVPGITVFGTLRYSNTTLYISIPLDGDYFIVTVKSEETGQIWETTAENALQIKIVFDGRKGDYQLCIESKDSIYTGWFTI